MKLPPDGGADAPNDSGSAAADPGHRHETPQRKIDRKALDDIFGDVLPDTTRDERGQDSGSDGYSEQWYRDNRPPHHGG
ncbi:hypothetical protein ABIB25_002357 [Nakamurella sp. UYEF19]|uniref:hypothetical protein n=1 Tax=Nakamurella sp. UYEF19 TaxID=1756392 RepID=UPI00339416DB